MILVVGVGCCWTFSSKDTPSMERLQDEPETLEVDQITPDQPKPTALEEAKENLQELKANPRYFVCYMLSKYCCTMTEITSRPEIVLWYAANCLSYLGFYVPFVNLVSIEAGGQPAALIYQ